MLATITCPECKTEGRFSILEQTYEGPYKCWKCRQMFYIELDGQEVKTCRLLGDEEFARLQQVDKLKRKFKKDEED